MATSGNRLGGSDVVFQAPQVKVAAFADNKDFSRELAPLEYLTLYNGRGADKGAWRQKKGLSLNVTNGHISTEISGKRYTHLLQALVRGDSGFRWKLWNSHYFEQRRDGQALLRTMLGAPGADAELDSSFNKLSKFFGGDNRFLQVVTVLLSEGVINVNLASALIKTGASGRCNAEEVVSLLGTSGIEEGRLALVQPIMAQAKYKSPLVMALVNGIGDYAETHNAAPAVLLPKLTPLIAVANTLVNANTSFAQAWRYAVAIEDASKYLAPDYPPVADLADRKNVCRQQIELLNGVLNLGLDLSLEVTSWPPFFRNLYNGGDYLITSNLCSLWANSANRDSLNQLLAAVRDSNEEPAVALFNGSFKNDMKELALFYLPAVKGLYAAQLPLQQDAELPVNMLLNAAFFEAEASAGLPEGEADVRLTNFALLFSSEDPRLVALKRVIVEKFLRGEAVIADLVKPPQIDNGEDGIMARIRQTESLQEAWGRIVRSAGLDRRTPSPDLLQPGTPPPPLSVAGEGTVQAPPPDVVQPMPTAPADQRLVALQGVFHELGRDADIPRILFDPQNPVDVAVVELATLLFGSREGAPFVRGRQDALRNALIGTPVGQDVRDRALKQFLRPVIKTEGERLSWFRRLNPRQGGSSGGVLATLRNNLNGALR